MVALARMPCAYVLYKCSAQGRSNTFDFFGDFSFYSKFLCWGKKMKWSRSYSLIPIASLISLWNSKWIEVVHIYDTKMHASGCIRSSALKWLKVPSGLNTLIRHLEVRQATLWNRNFTKLLPINGLLLRILNKQGMLESVTPFNELQRPYAKMTAIFILFFLLIFEL